jgi:cyclophilin family peptidyl-prolyl cis-trans isomerase
MLVAALLAVLAQAPVAPPAVEPPKPDGPVVVLETTMGDIKIALYKGKSSATVDNFLKYVRAHFYDGTIFHRVIPGFMVQGGGFTPDMVEKPTRSPVRNEAKNGLRNVRGSVAMARTTDPNSATSQFFINVKNNHSLDYGIGGAGYAVFGQVIEGMDVADKIVAVPTTSKGSNQNVPIKPVLITAAREVAVAVEPPAPPAAASIPAAKP